MKRINKKKVSIAIILVVIIVGIIIGLIVYNLGRQEDMSIQKEALDEHHKSPMMEEIAKLRDKYHLHMRVEQFVEKEN